MSDGIGFYHKDFCVLKLYTNHVGDLNKLGFREQAIAQNDGYIRVGAKSFARIRYEATVATADTFDELSAKMSELAEKIRETNCKSARVLTKYICVD